MSDSELEAFVSGLLEYADVLPGDKKHPVEVLVLRGHLLIERELRRLIEAKLPRQWKKKRRKLGTLTVSVGGLRWWPHKAPRERQRTWEELAEWFEG